MAVAKSSHMKSAGVNASSSSQVTLSKKTEWSVLSIL